MRWLALLCLLPSAGLADYVTPLRTLRAGTIIEPHHVAIDPRNIAGALVHLDEAVGLEARTTLYAGRPIRVGDLGPPALVQRNQKVSLIYAQSGLQISTDGRALARGGLGDVIRVMNLASRATLFGEVLADGRIEIQN